MNVQQLNELTFSEQLVLIPIKGRFIAERQGSDRHVKLYYWGNHFIEIYYRWPLNRGLGAHWEPYQVSAFVDNAGCADRLTPYVEQLTLCDLQK
ncbi:hypothetical protein [Spirosoma radiotolerans]|uniref:Uncharacterized protein n=1 Tax=Spirosoma radiotolerans TaxID=1379870 RepID=A0A0E3V633_9BACT|nr:hypothetical protein [Spirosoma radiotolerans]AKD54181.1 hypothetical protein SD10_03905 [Spirosoma radiotolerans]